VLYGAVKGGSSLKQREKARFRDGSTNTALVFQFYPSGRGPELPEKKKKGPQKKKLGLQSNPSNKRKPPTILHLHTPREKGKKVPRWRSWANRPAPPGRNLGLRPNIYWGVSPEGNQKCTALYPPERKLNPEKLPSMATHGAQGSAISPALPNVLLMEIREKQ